MTDRELLLTFIGSLTLCGHMGDVSNDVHEVLKRLGVQKEIMDAEWDDLGMELGRLGIKTLYGTALCSPEDAE